VLKTVISTFVITSAKKVYNKAFHNTVVVNHNPISAKSENQVLYLSYLNANNTKLIFGLGYAGTGKTYIACQYAMQQLINSKCQRIVITKPFVTVSDESIGFLPGSLESKMQPWMHNMLQCMNSGVSSKSITKRFVDSNQIEFAPMGFMRGSTIQDTIVIADEMQNSSPSQMKMLLTRIGTNTKVIITGDINQKDIPQKSGIEDFLEKLSNPNKIKDYDNTIKIVKFGIEDVQREEFVKQILELYEGNKNTRLNTLQLYNNILSDAPKPKVYYEADGNQDSAMIPKKLK
jgi:phosphate starvation-inducible PhoH-like protein